MKLSAKKIAADIARLLRDLGCRPEGIFKDAPARAATLWIEHLLKGSTVDLNTLLGKGILLKQPSSAVYILDIAIHLLCPHHLTVSFGKAYVAYQPGKRLVGFGRIAALVQAATSRFILQEEAGADIAACLLANLQPRGVVVLLQATHPCHNIMHPRSHQAVTSTLATLGNKQVIRYLKKDLFSQLAVNSRSCS